MTITLDIVAGATTVNLNSGGKLLMKYVPKTDERGLGTIVESAEIFISGTSVSDFLSKREAIETLLAQAAEYQETKRGDRVYLHFLPDGASDTRRSEILRGHLVLDEQALEAWQWGSRRVRANVVYERRGYWEAASESVLGLTNGNGSGVTAGLKVYNCNDGSGSSPNKRNNYVEISGASVVGNLPADCRILLTNTYNDSARLNNVWVAHNVYSDPSNFQHFLEGEAVSYGGTNGASASYSGGYYRQFTWTGDYQQIIARWLLDTTFLNRAGGRWFKLLAGFAGVVSGIKLQAKLTFPAGTPLTVVSSSQEVTLSDKKIQDIGTLQIPPWLPGETNFAPIDLSLYARKTGGGSFSLDYLQISPLDSYRILTPRGYGAAYNVSICDDGMGQVTWTSGWAGGGITGHYTGVGERVRLFPGRTQRLIFLQRNTSGNIPIDATMSVRVFYRARWS